MPLRASQFVRSKIKGSFFQQWHFGKTISLRGKCVFASGFGAENFEK